MALVQEGRKSSLPVFIDQGFRNGIPRSSLYRNCSLRPCAGRTYLQFVQPGRYQVYETARSHVHLVAGCDRVVFAAASEIFDFLEHPLIKNTAPPSFLTDLRTEARREVGPLPSSHDSPLERSEQRSKNVKALFDAGFLIDAGTDAPYPGGISG